jgi:uncharacterized protein
MKPVFMFRLLVLLAILGASAAAMGAEDLNAIRARMEQRVSAIDAMKDRHVVGESNRGFLEPRGNLSGGEQQTVSAENSDRRTVYAAIAAQTGADPDFVGRQRAQRIAAASKRGVWLQSPDGAWYQKN